MTTRKNWVDISIVIWTIALLIAAGIQLTAEPALAAAVDCGDMCDAECSPDGGCGGVLDYGENSTDCTFVCADNPEDVIFCGGGAGV